MRYSVSVTTNNREFRMSKKVIQRKMAVILHYIREICLYLFMFRAKIKYYNNIVTKFAIK